MWKLFAILLFRVGRSMVSRQRQLSRWAVSPAGRLIAGFLAANAAAHAQVVPDGQTATSVARSGATTSVTTGTVAGRTGFNSFSQFNVAGQTTVNLVLPGQAVNLINIVRDERSQIDGTVNSIRDGAIGGNLYFLNPHGFLVGAGGRFNVGSLSLQTPTPGFVSGFFSNGTPDAARTIQVLDGSAPVNPDASIDFRGTVNAIGDVRLSAGTLRVGGQIFSGARFVGQAPDFSDVVNARGLASSSAVQVRGGRILLIAEGDLSVSGTVSSPGTAGEAGGSLMLRAGRDIDVQPGALLAARGEGERSNGGTIDVMAGRDALFGGGLIDASAGRSGDGGAIEFSAARGVSLSGGTFSAAATNGSRGQVRIDPEEVTVDRLQSNGADIDISAIDSITVHSGVVLSTRQVAGSPSAADLVSGAAVSTGDSGNISLTAPVIAIDPFARLVTFASGGHNAGNITLDASGNDLLGHSVTIASGALLNASAATGSAGAISVKAGEITVNAATLRAVSSNGSTGSIALEATRTPALSIFGYRSGSASVRLDGATLEAADITASAKTVMKNEWINGYADGANNLDNVIDGATSVLSTAVDQGSNFLANLGGFNIVHSQVVASATVDVLNSTHLTASRQVALSAENDTEAGVKRAATAPNFSPVGIGAMYMRNDATATVTVDGSAHITARDLALRAHNTAAIAGDVEGAADGASAVSFALGITRANVHAKATVAAGATLNVSGDLTVAATSLNNFENKTATKTGQDAGGQGVGAVAVAISENTVDATAELNANVSGATSVQVLAINRTTANKTISQTEVGQELADAIVNGVQRKASVLTDSGTALAGALFGQNPLVSDKVKPKEQPFRLGGAVTYTTNDFSANATIGEGAQIGASGQIVTAARTVAEGTGAQAHAAAVSNSKGANTTTDTAQVSMSAGIAIADYNHSADAKVGANAVLTAGRIGVDADVSLPRNAPGSIGRWSSFEAVSTNLENALSYVDPFSYFNGGASAQSSATNVGLSGSFNWQTYDGQAHAIVDHGASLRLSGSAGAWTYGFAMDAAQPTQTQDFAFAHAAQVQAAQDAELWFLAGKPVPVVASGPKALGGSYNQVTSTGETLALVREGVEVRGSAGATASASELGVSAATSDTMVAAGIAAGSGESFGLAGSFSVNKVDRTTLAAIDDEARVRAGRVAVQAAQDMVSWAIGGGLASAQGSAVGVGVGVNEGKANVRAAIADIDTAGGGSSTQALTDGTVITPHLDVSSDAQGHLQSIALAGAYAGNSDTAGTGFFDKLGDKVDNLLFAVAKVVDAKPEEGATKQTKQDKTPQKYSFTLAGAGSVAVNLTEVASTAEVVGAHVTQTSAAHDAALAVRAIEDTDIVSASGAGALTRAQQSGGGNSVGVAGAVAVNVLSGGAQARIASSTVSDANDVTVQAIKAGEVLSLGVGLNINASASTRTSWQGTGSVSVTLSDTDNDEATLDKVTAAIDGSTLTHDAAAATGELAVTAYNRAQLGTGAGALNAAGKNAVGGAVTYSDLRNTTEARIGSSTVTAAQTVDVQAYNAMQIAAGAAMATVTSRDSATTISAAVVINQTTNQTSAQVSGSTIGAAERINVEARDVDQVAALETLLATPSTGVTRGEGYDYSGADVRSTAGAQGATGANSIVAVAGNLAVAVGSGSRNAGVSVNYNHIGNTLSSRVDASSLTVASGATDGITVTADGKANILGLAVGVAVSDAWNVTGSVAISDIDNQVTAAIDNQRAAPATGRAPISTPVLSVAAADHSRIDSLAGQVTVSMNGSAVGAAVSYNAIDNTVQAQLANAEVSGNRALTVRADGDSRIRDIAVAGAVGAGSNSIGFAGSVALNFIDDLTSATVSNASITQRSAAGDTLDVLATDTAQISALSGAIAGGGQGGAGLAFSLNKIGSFDAADTGHATTASVTDSVVTDADAATVKAQSTSGIDAIGAALSGGKDFAVSGSFSINHIAARTTGSVLRGRFSGAGTDLAVGADNDGTIRSISGGAAFSGSASVGAGLAFNRIANTTEASLSGLGSAAHALRSLELSASAQPQISSLTIGAAIGGDVGVGASVAVNLIGGSTAARIDGGAQVVAQNNVGVVADSDERITNAAGSAGIGLSTAGVGASVSTNFINGSTQASIEGASTHVSALGLGADGVTVASGALVNDESVDGGSLQQRKDAISNYGRPDLAQQTESVRGVAVNASATHSIEGLSANIAAGFYAGVGVVANVNVIGGATRAAVTEATVNDAAGAGTAQQASVKASDHASANAFLGNVAGGAAGVGLTGDVTVYSRETTARVTDAALNAAGTADIDAVSTQRATSFAAGGAAGVAGVAGTASVVKFASLTEASLTRGTATVGVLDIDASHTSRVQQTAGAVGIGAVGAGIGVGVALDTSTTRAQIDHATVAATGAVAVDAATRTEVDVLSVAGGLAAGIGFAGNAAVVVTNSTTEAQVLGGTIGSSAQRAGSLTVNAFDAVTVTANGGSAGAGAGAGLAGGASVVKTENDTHALIQDASVDTRGTTAVGARTERNLEAGAVALGAGTVGLAGTAAVILAGSNSAEASGQVDSNGGTLTEVDRIAGAGLLNNRGGSGDQTVSNRDGAVTMSASDVANVNSGATVAVRDRATQVATTRTAAQISGGHVVAGAVQVAASEGNQSRGLAGAAALGAAGFGAAVAVTEIRSQVTASIGAGAQIEAGAGGLSVQASSGLLDPAQPTAGAEAYQGSGGLIAAGAAIARANDFSSVTAEVGGSGTSLSVTGDAAIEATANSSGSAKSVGLSAGLVGVGVSDARVTSTQTASAQLGSAVTGTVTGRLRVGAAGDESLNVAAAAGAAGVASGAAALASNTDTSTTSATVATSRDDAPFTAGRIEVDARHVARVDGAVNTMAAGVVGGSGGEITHTVNNTTLAGFADDTVVRAKEIAVSAEGVAIKPERSGFNLQAGAGGAIGVSAAGSTTTITLDTEAFVGKDAQLAGTGTRTDPGDFRFGAHNEVRARDAVNLDAGGAIAVADADSTISATLTTAVTVDERARVSAQGDLSLGAWSTGDVANHTYGKTYGLAGAPVGRATATLHATDTVGVKTGAVLFSLGDTTLAAGSSVDGQPSTLAAEARTDVFNKTAFPVVTVPVADGTAIASSRIDVAAGAQVNAVANVNLYADAARATAVGVGVGKDLYREVLAAIANAFLSLFGADDVSLDIRTGSATARAGSGVNVDGAVRAGVQNKQFLVVGSDGTVLQQSDGVRITRTVENLYNNLVADIDYYEGRIAEYAGNAASDAASATAIAAFRAEVQRIRQEMLDLKLAQLAYDPAHPNDAAYASIVPLTNAQQGFITVADVLARGGDINVRGQQLAGTGRLSAPNDAEIAIVNNSSDYLRVNSLVIPDGLGGHIRLNGVDRHSSAEVGASFAEFTTGAGTQPLIRVENNFVPPPLSDARAPDLQVQGDIANLDGAVAITNQAGKVVVQRKPGTNAVANIDARTVDIVAGGDFIQGYVDGFKNVAGDPKLQWKATADSAEAGKTDTFSDTAPVVEPGQITGTNVVVSARYLNINGLIRAGLPDWQLDLPATLDATIDGFKAQWVQRGRSGDPLFPLTPRVTRAGEMQTWYNAATGRIEVEAIRVQGGRMDLFGEILSTGGGRLEALDGYGSFNIANHTSYALDVKGLDTGSGAEGKITIVDSARSAASMGGNSGPLVTVFTRSGSGAAQRVAATYYDINPADGKLHEIGTPLDLGTAREGSDLKYEPVSGQRYVWVTGQRQTELQYMTYQTNSIFWGGIDTSSFSYTTIGPKIPSTPTSLLQGEYTPAVKGASQSHLYTYGYEEFDTSGPLRIARFGPSSSCNDWLCFSKTYTLVDLYANGSKIVNTHSLKADFPIPIAFIGNDVGSIKVDSDAGIVLSGNAVRNASGNTTLASSAGSIVGESDRGIVTGRNVNLSALGSIRGAAATDALQVDVNGGLLSASAGGDLRLHERGGTAQYGTLSAGQVLALRSEGGVEGSAAVLAGQRIEIDAAKGVGAAAAVTLQRGEGGVVVRAAENIGLRHDGDLYADRIESYGGDITLDVGGQLIDANRNDTRDERTLAQLRNVWDRARVLDNNGSGAVAASRADAVENYRLQRERDYFAYWAARHFDPATDPNVAYTPGASELRTFDALGWTAQQRQAYISEKTASWASFRGTTYDAQYHYTLTSADDAKIAAITQGVSWTEGQLTSALTRTLVDKQTTSTETRREDPNLVGRNITVRAGRGVGRLTDTVEIDTSQPLPTDQKWKLEVLAAAEVDDVGVDNVNRRLTVLQRDDVDFQASGNINISTAGHAYLGGQADLNLDAISAGGALRIKGAGSLWSAAQPGSGLVAGGNTVLEAATGQIGSAGAPLHLTFSGADTATLTARALGDIALDVSGALRLSNVYSQQGLVWLQASGAISDVAGAGVPAIDAASMTLRATSIGSRDNPLDLQTQRDATVRAQATDGELWLGDGNAPALGTATLRLADVRATGQVSVAAIDDLVAGSVRGSDVALYSLTGSVLGDAGGTGAQVVSTAPRGSVTVGAARDVGNASQPVRTEATRIDATAASGGVVLIESDDVILSAHAAQTVSAQVGGDVTAEGVTADALALQASGTAGVSGAVLGRSFDIRGQSVTVQLRQADGSATGLTGVLGGADGGRASRIEASIDSSLPLTLQKLYGRTVQLDTSAPVLTVQDGWIGQADIRVPGTYLLIDTVRPLPADVQLFAPGARYNFSVAGNEVVTNSFVVDKRSTHTTFSPQGRDVTIVDQAPRLAVIPRLPQSAGAPWVPPADERRVLTIGELRFEPDDEEGQSRKNESEAAK